MSLPTAIPVLLIPATAAFVLMGDNMPFDPISGGAGWVGTGLLGLILAWLLLRHLPDKDRIVLELVEKKWEAIRLLTAEYRESLKEMAAFQAKQLEIVVSTFQTAMIKVDGIGTKVDVAEAGVRNLILSDQKSSDDNAKAHKETRQVVNTLVQELKVISALTSKSKSYDKLPDVVADN
jgi:intracellular sulfur oxidation DsrE/DsrF family protein